MRMKAEMGVVPANPQKLGAGAKNRFNLTAFKRSQPS